MNDWAQSIIERDGLSFKEDIGFATYGVALCVKNIPIHAVRIRQTKFLRVSDDERAKSKRMLVDWYNEQPKEKIDSLYYQVAAAFDRDSKISTPFDTP